MFRMFGWMVIGALFLGSLYLAVNRIIQVDEAQQVFQSTVLARGQASEFFAYAPLFHLGPMTWIARHAGSAEAIFMGDRLLFLAVFWLNLVLLARICAGSFRLRPLLPWLLLAATLVPVWDYGFEIRHDNLLLTGLLVFWLMGRETRPRPGFTCAAAGALSVILQFVAFKAFLYWIPWAFVLVLLPRPAPARLSRVSRLMCWLGGAFVGLLAVRLAYALAGGWEVALAGFHQGVTTSTSARRLPPLPVLARMAGQTPLVTGAALAAAIAGCRSWAKEGRAFLRWDSLWPELALLVCALAAFLVNPTPFPYNLLFLTPFFLVASAAFWTTALQGLHTEAGLALLAGLVVICHALPFVQQTLRHFDHPNDRQVALMTLAETMTDPIKDRVFDGIGLVPTRKTIGHGWLLHTLTIDAFRTGRTPSVRTMLAQHPASVLIPSYRMDWLDEGDKQFINAHYLPLADDFWVLGGVLPPGGGAWTCLQGGAYQLRLGGPVPSQPGLMLQVDGQLRPDRSRLELAPGVHDLRSASSERISVVWLGPSLTTLPSLGPGEHLGLFVNWY